VPLQDMHAYKTNVINFKLKSETVRTPNIFDNMRFMYTSKCNTPQDEQTVNFS